jgi:hypothetical protein
MWGKDKGDVIRDQNRVRGGEKRRGRDRKLTVVVGGENGINALIMLVGRDRDFDLMLGRGTSRFPESPQMLNESLTNQIRELEG